jgi:hypothetical protein
MGGCSLMVVLFGRMLGQGRKEKKKHGKRRRKVEGKKKKRGRQVHNQTCKEVGRQL